MLACMVFSGAQLSDNGLFRLVGSTLEVQDGTGDWVSVGDSTFELVGEIDSVDPWTVAGTTFEIRETTQIAEGLEVGDLVKVRGAILEDKTWLAFSIALAEEPIDPIIILIGTVDSVDPWVVNGITLTVTDETDIQGDITVGAIVRVEILLLSDGAWEVLSIAPFGEHAETSGCATVIATVLSVHGNEIQFLGWPTPVILHEDVGSTISADQVVVAVVCVSEDGQIVVVQIILLDTDHEDGDAPTNGEKVLICHKPDKKGGNTLSISSSAVPAHLGHGDKLGPCP